MELNSIIGYGNLDNLHAQILSEQKERFDNLKKKHIPSQIATKNDKLILKEGTIIHGTSTNIDKLKSISDTGILCGQAVGVEEDGETYFCADFHRIPFDITLEEYNDWFPYNDGRCPMGKIEKLSSSKRIAFVISPNKDNEELLSYDCYRDTDNGRITKSFVNEKGLPMRKEVASSILYGVPSNCIDGIIVGTKVLENREMINFLIKTFPSTYIAYRTGDIIYKPGREEFLDIMIEKCLLENKVTRLENKIKGLNEANERLENSYNTLFSSVLTELNKEDCIKILEKIGYNSNYSYDELISEEKSRSK